MEKYVRIHENNKIHRNNQQFFRIEHLSHSNLMESHSTNLYTRKNDILQLYVTFDHIAEI